MQDRVSVNPGRVLITPENGAPAYYATMTRADNPTQEGTPLDKKSLLKDETVALFGLGVDAVPDDVLALLAKKTKVSLLWENASPVSAFAAQSIVAEWENSKGLLIISYSPSVSTHDGNVTSPASYKATFFEIVNGVGDSFYLETNARAGWFRSGMGMYVGARNVSRNVELLSGSLKFSECTGQATTTNNNATVTYSENVYNSFCVPFKIYQVGEVIA